MGVAGMPRSLLALGFLLGALLFPPAGSAEPEDHAGHSHAAEAPATPPARPRSSVSTSGLEDIFAKKTTEITYQTIESWMEGDVRVTVMLGNVEMRQEGLFLRADSVVGWYDEVAANAREEAARRGGQKPPSEPVFDEFYAEGFVRLVREFEVVEADQMYFDLRNHTGLVLETTIRTIDVKNKLPLAVRARELRQIDRTKFVAEEAQITTCEYGDPHLSVRVGKVEFQREASGGRASLKNVSGETSGIPFFYLPFYWTRIGQSYPLRSLSYTNSGRLGQTVRSDWGFDIKKYVRDEAGEIVRDAEGKAKEKKWGDLLFSADYMSKRGPGAGVDLEYGWENYSGYLNSYYVNDEGPGTHSDLDKRVQDPGSHNRWRLKAFHRQHLAPSWRADFEYSEQSDRFFLEEFFEKEFQEGKAQETYAYLRHTKENLGATLFANLRRNEFQNQNEYMPQASFYFLAEPLWNTGLYYTNFTQLANVRSRYDDQLDLNSERIWRFDTYHELSLPIDLSVVQVAPFAAVRYTGFEEDIDRDGGVDRVLSTGGVRLFTQLHRAYDTRWELVGLNGLRHIVSVDARYTNNLDTTQEHEELFAFDSVDALDHFEEVSVELRQRFQTRKNGNPDESFEFLTLGLEAEYYPDERRDVRTRNDQNFLYPMNWIPVAPVSKSGAFQRRNWSNLFFDLAFTPDAPFGVRWDMEFNQYGEGVQIAHTYLDYHPSKAFTITLSHNYVDGVTDAVGLSVKWQATEKWRIQWDEQYDFDRSEFLESRLAVRRDMHDYQVEGFVSLDEGKDDVTFGFLIAPAKKMRQREPFLDQSHGYSRD